MKGLFVLASMRAEKSFSGFQREDRKVRKVRASACCVSGAEYEPPAVGCYEFKISKIVSKQFLRARFCGEAGVPFFRTPAFARQNDGR
jgi:hypothetical protein